MAKRVDITEKLAFDENPILVVAGEELEVNSDAETMLRLMGVFGGGVGVTEINQALNLIFKPEDIDKLTNIKNNGKKLSAKSLMSIVEAAMDLVMGDNEGEQ